MNCIGAVIFRLVFAHYANGCEIEIMAEECEVWVEGRLIREIDRGCYVMLDKVLSISD